MKIFRYRRSIAIFFFSLFCLELLLPAVNVHALTSGPTQPEVQGFEPISTTDMVDHFTGDFTYNIPILDVDGYPINIFYHGGVTPEQEASWVGLGWNLNVGTINRNVRGIPDDFKGDVVENELHIKPEKNIRVGLGVGAELWGLGEPHLQLAANLSANLNVSNYKGVSVDFSAGVGIHKVGFPSVGLNLGVGSQSGASVGASVDYDFPSIFKSTEIVNEDNVSKTNGPSVGASHGYNTRTGLEDIAFSGYMKSAYENHSKNQKNSNYQAIGTAIIPIGLNNYVPVSGNTTNLTTFRGRLGVGT